jgi:hypothetical protein
MIPISIDADGTKCDFLKIIADSTMVFFKIKNNCFFGVSLGFMLP